MPDMFNFYVVLASQAKVTDAGRADTCRREVNAQSLQKIGTKEEGHSENKGSSGKTV